VKFLRL